MEPPRFMLSVHESFPDDDIPKQLFLQAHGHESIPAEGDRHVLVWWRNSPCNQKDKNEPVVAQVIQLTGNPGNYAYYAPFVDNRGLVSLESHDQFPLGTFHTTQRVAILGIAEDLVFERTSTVNGCRVWTKDLFAEMVKQGLLSEIVAEDVARRVPLKDRKSEDT